MDEQINDLVAKYALDAGSEEMLKNMNQGESAVAAYLSSCTARV